MIILRQKTTSQGDPEVSRNPQNRYSGDGEALVSPHNGISVAGDGIVKVPVRISNFQTEDGALHKSGRLRQTAHRVQRLHGLSGSALRQIVLRT